RQAHEHGQPDVADLFEQAAQTELLEHFAEEAALTSCAESDTANLRDAIAGESYEAETMYQQFEEDARADGDVAAARFAEVRQDKQRHRKAFVAMLARLESVVAVRKQ
ncbi:MAG: ferritin family protein, partial [Ktedonobacterales bacterium]